MKERKLKYLKSIKILNRYAGGLEFKEFKNLKLKYSNLKIKIVMSWLGF